MTDRNVRDELIGELRELCAIEGRPLTVGERARTKIAMSEAAAALEAARADAARWRYARRFLAIDDIEKWPEMLKRGHKPSEAGNVSADAAIDAAMAQGA